MTKAGVFLFLGLFGISVAIAGNETAAFLSGNISVFIMPEFDRNITHINDGPTVGFGGGLGIRIINTLYITTSVTYLPRSGSEFTLSLGRRTDETQKKYREVRMDIGPMLRPRLSPSLWLNSEFGATYFGVGDVPGISDGTAFWGAYAGVGLEHSPASVLSMFLAIKYRYLQKYSADFGGAEIQFGVRFLAASEERK